MVVAQTDVTALPAEPTEAIPLHSVNALANEKLFEMIISWTNNKRTVTG
jgi:hypothetical protein